MMGNAADNPVGYIHKSVVSDVAFSMITPRFKYASTSGPAPRSGARAELLRLSRVLLIRFTV